MIALVMGMWKQARGLTPQRVGALLSLVATSVTAAGDSSVLSFERDGAPVREISVQRLSEQCGLRPVWVERDPYYETSKVYLACPLHTVLDLGFAAPAAPGATFILRARDGYSKTASAERLAESGGYLAFADLGEFARDATEPPVPVPWPPIGRSGADPSPLYMVWTGVDQADPHHYPWPYQLASIEIGSFEGRYPRTVPSSAPADSPARAGYEIFKRECVACHAVNGEGGKVGPDLNVPRGISEYRPRAQIKAFIRNPESFRYTSMPSNLHLSERDLDALVAYFDVMKDLKHDPKQVDTGDL
ncbi:cytochrome c [Myxococcota bacterium]|nr:cytochrome c [Myxococcota bacterium]